jgi:septal ring factor EnvC (AmiA/AmiB activator)
MSLSFIDIMACGLGAVALMFIFVKEAKFSPLNTDYSQEASSALDSVEALKSKSNKNQATLNSLKNRIDELIKQIANTELELKISDQVIAELSQANKDILDEIKLANKSKTPINTPNKQTYLSGCNVSGNKIILLLDKSLSMLDKNLV